jgi:hypothetical protein
MAAYALRERHARSASLNIHHDRDADGAGLLQRSGEPRSPPSMFMSPWRGVRAAHHDLAFPLLMLFST